MALHPLDMAGGVGRVSLSMLARGLQVCVLVTATLAWTFVHPLRGKGFRGRETVTQFVRIGVDSIGIVGLICFLIGAIMAMQSYYQLDRFGATAFVANLVAVAAMRELAPLMTAILVTGRSGSAITAEIGAMKVAQELDALEVMGINPIKFLVVPKFVALVIALPCLTVLGTVIMMGGGFVTAVFAMHMDPNRYVTNSMDALQVLDFATGLTKSVFFALVICWVGVHRGFQVSGGAAEVGRYTTSSVVTSIVFIILVDLLFTWIFFQ